MKKRVEGRLVTGERPLRKYLGGGVRLNLRGREYRMLTVKRMDRVSSLVLEEYVTYKCHFVHNLCGLYRQVRETKINFL